MDIYFNAIARIKLIIILEKRSPATLYIYNIAGDFFPKYYPIA